jgi:hypothetical protein
MDENSLGENGKAEFWWKRLGEPALAWTIALGLVASWAYSCPPVLNRGAALELIKGAPINKSYSSST